MLNADPKFLSKDTAFCDASLYTAMATGAVLSVWLVVVCLQCYQGSMNKSCGIISVSIINAHVLRLISRAGNSI